jgi:hypothetical protein
MKLTTEKWLLTIILGRGLLAGTAVAQTASTPVEPPTPAPRTIEPPARKKFCVLTPKQISSRGRKSLPIQRR